MGIAAEGAHEVVKILESLIYFWLGPDSTARFFWEDRKLYVGLAIWGSVWYRYFQGVSASSMVSQFHLTALLVLGMDLAVLSLLQTMGGGGIVGLFALCFGNVELSKKLWTSTQRRGPRTVFTANSIYENLEMNFFQVQWIFAGQTLLTIFLLYSVYYNYEQKSESVTYSFWLAAYISVQMSGFFKRSRDSQLGSTWDLERWRDLVTFNSRMTYRRAGSTEHVYSVTDLEIKSRDWMGFVVNTFYRDIIAFITPVLCMQSDDAVDFVQNCFALSYITQLDDMSDGKEFEVVPVAEAAPTQTLLATHGNYVPPAHTIVASHQEETASEAVG